MQVQGLQQMCYHRMRPPSEGKFSALWAEVSHRLQCIHTSAAPGRHIKKHACIGSHAKQVANPSLAYLNLFCLRTWHCYLSISLDSQLSQCAEHHMGKCSLLVLDSTWAEVLSCLYRFGLLCLFLVF